MTNQIKWEHCDGVKISEDRKNQWIKEAIEVLKNNLENQHWVQCGDTHLVVTKHDGFYMVEDFVPRKFAIIESKDKIACCCKISTLAQIGCQCGGI